MTAGALSTSSPPPQGPQAPPEDHRKLLSSLRLKVVLSAFVGLLVLALSTLTLVLVSNIFARLEPSLQTDLVWKAQRGAIELARSADLSLAAGEYAAINKAFSEFFGAPDVLALVAADPSGRVVATKGVAPEPAERLFSGRPREVRKEAGHYVAWAESDIEGNVVGRVALILSTSRLAEGARIRHQMWLVGGVACVIALGGSLLFVHMYLVPLIGLTNSALRVRGEMEIARRIQMSILPNEVKIPHCEFAAAMIPATEVGGDYYDVVSGKDATWIGVGDVAGHGVGAGLVMLMVQSTVSALVREKPDATPSEIVAVLNTVLVDNIRRRIGSDEHVTFTLLRLDPQTGEIVYAGAHEEIIICRAATGRCETIETLGAWLGAVPNLGRMLVDNTLKLERGDLILLYTDGVTEMQSASGDRFGLERLVAEIERRHTEPAHVIQQGVMDVVTKFGPVQEDDVTIVAMRYLGA